MTTKTFHVSELDDMCEVMDDLQLLIDQGRIKVRNTPDGPEYCIVEQDDEFTT